jgi:signal transduction histidine kinase
MAPPRSARWRSGPTSACARSGRTLVLHELRQPLASIALSLDPLAQAAVTTAQARAAQRIRMATRAMTRIVSDLLDVSLLDGEHLTLETTRLPLERWLEDLLERLGAGLGERFGLEAAAPVGEVLADPGRLEQILTNLLTNAAKYGAPGGDIRVLVEPRGAFVAIAVSNQGAGLAPAELARLFSRFYRTDSARRGRSGLGLGLYITKAWSRPTAATSRWRARRARPPPSAITLPAGPTPSRRPTR